MLKTKRVQLVDGECSHATLSAAETASQPLAALAGSVSQCGINDLDQRVVAGRPRRAWHLKSVCVKDHDDYGCEAGGLPVKVEDFNTDERAWATRIAIRRVPVSERCSPSEVAFAPPITSMKNRFGISHTPYFAARRR